MNIKNGLIVGKTLSGVKMVQLNTKDETISTKDQEIVVFWKGKHSLMRSAQVGDGMEVVKIIQRPFLIHSLEKKFWELGMSMYREYDEIEGKIVSYVYGFPKDQESIEDFQELISKNGSLLKVKSSGRFVVLDGDIPELPSDNEGLRVQLLHGGFDATLSFLFGLFTVFGSWVHDEELLFNALIQIPITGNLASYVDLFGWLAEVCSKHGMVIRSEYIDGKSGQQLQFSIHDWEILKHFAMWEFDEDDDVVVAKYKSMISQKESLKNFLKESNADKKLIEEVGYSVIKYCKI